ncbi:MAG: FtsX-like permease family protein [Candidatus Latescibacterota bacterium]
MATQSQSVGGGIGQQIVLPLSKAVEISAKSLKIRLGRSLITMSGIILAIAFLMSIWTSSAIVDGLRAADDANINLLLQRKGIETGSDAMGEERAKNTWLVVLSLMVCVVGIVNSMLMSVTERFREIGTMKCLGALDSFIIKLFVLESSFQGTVGTVIGVIIGLLLTILMSMGSYGTLIFDHFPGVDILKWGALSIVIGSFLSVIGAIYPSYTAARMEPVDAMRVDQ